MGDEAHERLSVLRATMGWRGAQENFGQNVSQIAGSGTCQAYLSHINIGNISNILRVKHYKIPKMCSNDGGVVGYCPFLFLNLSSRLTLMTNMKVVTLSVY